MLIIARINPIMSTNVLTLVVVIILTTKLPTFPLKKHKTFRFVQNVMRLIGIDTKVVCVINKSVAMIRTKRKCLFCLPKLV